MGDLPISPVFAGRAQQIAERAEAAAPPPEELPCPQRTAWGTCDASTTARCSRCGAVRCIRHLVDRCPEGCAEDHAPALPPGRHRMGVCNACFQASEPRGEIWGAEDAAQDGRSWVDGLRETLHRWGGA